MAPALFNFIASVQHEVDELQRLDPVVESLVAARSAMRRIFRSSGVTLPGFEPMQTSIGAPVCWQWPLIGLATATMGADRTWAMPVARPAVTAVVRVLV
ncbi:MAG: hypothetical protein ACYDB8_06300 [Acidiferrobacterales bacterium]